MARTVDQIIKQQLGGLLAEVAMLTAEIERLNEELAKRPPVEELPDGQAN